MTWLSVMHIISFEVVNAILQLEYFIKRLICSTTSTLQMGIPQNFAYFLITICRFLYMMAI
jgi:hypothetical protein